VQFRSNLLRLSLRSTKEFRETLVTASTIPRLDSTQGLANTSSAVLNVLVRQQLADGIPILTIAVAQPASTSVAMTIPQVIDSPRVGIAYSVEFNNVDGYFRLAHTRWPTVGKSYAGPSSNGKKKTWPLKIAAKVENLKRGNPPTHGFV
jgi:hypothetical protein